MKRPYYNLEERQFIVENNTVYSAQLIFNLELLKFGRIIFKHIKAVLNYINKILYL